MERAVKFAKVIRNNWKKSVVGAFALYYGAATAKEKYEINVLMRAACQEAAQWGDRVIPIDRNPTLVTVVLNPVANKRGAKQDFEKYCAPLLHLAGLQVDVIQTTSEGNAKEIVENLKGTEAIIIAGGDGTLSECVTGLLRRTDGAHRFPMGILPLGQTNTLGSDMFPGGKGVKKVQQLINASMAIIKGDTVLKDAIKIEPIDEEGEIKKPVYALNSIYWGAFRDTEARKDRYWFVGPLRDYATFVFNGYKNSLSWECCGSLIYTPPCAGCKNCVKRQEVKSKWSFFMPVKSESLEELAENPECSVTNEICFKTADFQVVTPNVGENNGYPALKIVLGKPKFTYTEFVKEGWRRLKGRSLDNENVILARTIEILPKEIKEGESIEIDKEEFDVKPVKVTLLPKVVRLYFSQYT